MRVTFRFDKAGCPATAWSNEGDNVSIGTGSVDALTDELEPMGCLRFYGADSPVKTTPAVISINSDYLASTLTPRERTKCN